jgi:predicted  nucleic acid-binding Zn-ribbon protein
MSKDELTDYLTDAHRGELNVRFRELVKENKKLSETNEHLKDAVKDNERIIYEIESAFDEARNMIRG